MLLGFRLLERFWSFFCFLLLRMEDIASGMARRLAIDDDEDLKVVTLEDVGGSEVQRFWLVGKLLTTKEYHKEAFVSTMKKIWHVKGGVIITQWEDSDRWLFSFKSDFDRRKVFDGCPWTFDNALLLLAMMDGRSDPTQVPLHL